MTSDKSVAIIGTGTTAVGKVPDMSPTTLHVEAIHSACQDAHLDVQDIDMLVTANSRAEPFTYHAESIAEALGASPERCLTVSTGGSATVTAIAAAVEAVRANTASIAVVAMGDSLATGMGRSKAIESMAGHALPHFEAPLGPTIPSLYALIAHRYMNTFGIDAATIAAATVSDRYYGARNSEAQFRSETSVQEVLDSRLIADPLRLLNCAPVSDGAGAVVISRPERSHGRVVAAILGYAAAADYEHISSSRGLIPTAARRSSELALRRAERTVDDIDLAMIYDPFSFMLGLMIEDLGFCASGEGAAFVSEGGTLPRGRLPTNTHGGLLAHSHAGRPSGLFLIIEAARQLMDRAGDRQVVASTAICHMSGGISSSHADLVLSCGGK